MCNVEERFRKYAENLHAEAATMHRIATHQKDELSVVRAHAIDKIADDLLVILDQK